MGLVELNNKLNFQDEYAILHLYYLYILHIHEDLIFPRKLVV